MSGDSNSHHASFGTIAVHVGSEPDAHSGAVVAPISLATTFAQHSPGVKMGHEHVNSFGKGFEYSRTGNPTRGAFERQVAACEHGQYCCAFASGLSATSALLHLFKSGDHIVCIDDVYGGTQRYFRRIVGPMAGINFTFIDIVDGSSVEAAILPETKLIWIETPTNPLLKIVDIRSVAEVAKRRNVLLCVDNTFLSPYFQNPLDLGADIVIHSVTKYIGGHSDVVMGVVITNSEDINTRLRFIQNGVGAVPSPFDCYMAMRGLKTLHVRMEAAARNAQAVAEFLQAHTLVERVIYPGLASHPQHAIARAQQHGFGAMITFFLRGGEAEASRFLASLKVFTLAESLGAVESLAESPAIMTHASVPPEHRALIGITDNLVRLSIGIEAQHDIIADLEQALQASQQSA